MLVTLKREYMPILGEFMAKEDVRYYLNGFHVKPHQEGQGIILTATDVHRAVVIHDKDGTADGEYILPISKPLLAASKKANTSQKLPLNQVHYIDGRVLVRNFDDESGELPCIDPENAPVLVGYTEYFDVIDGKYPNVGRIVNLEPEPVSKIALNVDYIGKLKCITSKYKIANLNFHGETNSITCRSGFDGEIFALVMPAHSEQTWDGIPEFAKIAGHQPEEDQSEKSENKE